MVDTVKTFANGKFTGANIVNGVFPLVTNAATTRAVVKDVAVDSTFSSVDTDGNALVFNLENNGFKINTAKNLSGSEIVDAGQDLVFSPDPALGSNAAGYSVYGKRTFWSSGTTSLIENSVAPNADITVGKYKSLLQGVAFIQDKFDASVTEIVTQNNQATTPRTMLQSPQWIFRTSTYAYYYYFTNGQQAHYLARSEITGGNSFSPWSAIANSNGSAPTFNVTDKTFLFLSSGGVNLQRHDMDTNITTVVKANFGSGNGQNQCACEINDMFFVRTGNNQTVQVFDTLNVANAKFNITVPQGLPQNNQPYPVIGGTYNPVDNTYYILAGSNVGKFMFSIKAQVGGRLTGSETIVDLGSVTNFGITDYVQIAHVQGDNFGNLSVMQTSTTRKTFNFVNGAATQVGDTLALGTNTGNRNFAIVAPNYPTATATLTPAELDIKLATKVSGIEITEG